MMPRALLIVALLTAQFISWNASPLFICMDGDGELCVDLGPGSCNCQHQHDSAKNAGNEGREQRVKDTSCDCTHVQITVAWTAVTVSPEGTRSVVLPSLTAVVSEVDGACLRLPRSTEALLSPPHNVFCPQNTARGLILRC
jgi:hypothetical protein